MSETTTPALSPEQLQKSWDQNVAPLIRGGYLMAIGEMIEFIKTLKALDPDNYSLLCDKLTTMMSTPRIADRNLLSEETKRHIKSQDEYREMIKRFISLRDAQKAYFKSRTNTDYSQAREWERMVDAILKDYR